jgi:hypothetical protein
MMQVGNERKPFARKQQERGVGHNLSALSFDNAHLSRVVARKMLNANIGNEDSLFFLSHSLSILCTS